MVDDELGQWPGRRGSLDETISIIDGYDMSQMRDPAGKEMMALSDSTPQRGPHQIGEKRVKRQRPQPLILRHNGSVAQ